VDAEDYVSDGAGIFKQSIGARNRVGKGLSYRPARLHRLAELIPWNRFLGSLNKSLQSSGSGCEILKTVVVDKHKDWFRVVDKHKNLCQGGC